MHSIAILQEVQQLYSVSDRLDLLAEEHPLVSEALITISGSVRSIRVLVALTNGVLNETDILRHRSERQRETNRTHVATAASAGRPEPALSERSEPKGGSPAAPGSGRNSLLRSLCVN